MDKFEYELKEKVEYAAGGELATGSFITLLPPTSKNMGSVAFLKQAFYRALPKDVDEDDKDKDDDKDVITGEIIMQLLMISQDVDLYKVLLTAKELFISGIALIDGETKVTKKIMDAVGINDLENMTGEYMANFILASALQRPKKS